MTSFTEEKEDSACLPCELPMVAKNPQETKVILRDWNEGKFCFGCPYEHTASCETRLNWCVENRISQQALESEVSDDNR